VPPGTPDAVMAQMGREEKRREEKRREEKKKL
jgi:hypothetical protein